MSKKIRELARNLIETSNQEGMLFSELVVILREEKEKLREEMVESNIARTAEEELFRKKAEKFLKKAKNNPNCKTKFHTKNFMEKYLEILCVYFSYQNLYKNHTEVHKVVSDADIIDNIKYIKRLPKNDFGSLFLHYVKFVV